MDVFLNLLALAWYVTLRIHRIARDKPPPLAFPVERLQTCAGAIRTLLCVFLVSEHQMQSKWFHFWVLKSCFGFF
jgi:hypothetical protein